MRKTVLKMNNSRYNAIEGKTTSPLRQKPHTTQYSYFAGAFFCMGWLEVDH
jgi:hypothetical protein